MTQIFKDDGKVVPVTVVRQLDVTQEISEEFVNKPVTIVGVSKGKGFTGVMKKWNFSGAKATHGQSDKPRAAGSIGAQTPNRVLKGKKMAGRHGGAQITVKGLKIVRINAESKELMLSGPVPGARNSEVLIRVL